MSCIATWCGWSFHFWCCILTHWLFLSLLNIPQDWYYIYTIDTWCRWLFAYSFPLKWLCISIFPPLKSHISSEVSWTKPCSLLTLYYLLVCSKSFKEYHIQKCIIWFFWGQASFKRLLNLLNRCVIISWILVSVILIISTPFLETTCKVVIQNDHCIQYINRWYLCKISRCCWSRFCSIFILCNHSRSWYYLWCLDIIELLFHRFPHWAWW